jgi:hypothetical protein
VLCTQPWMIYEANVHTLPVFSHECIQQVIVRQPSIASGICKVLLLSDDLRSRHRVAWPPRLPRYLVKSTRDSPWVGASMAPHKGRVK